MSFIKLKYSKFDFALGFCLDYRTHGSDVWGHVSGFTVGVGLKGLASKATPIDNTLDSYPLYLND